MALNAPPADRKRVKVYELRNNDWFDRGTGFCTGRNDNYESRIHVQSEDNPDHTLLETRISKDDGYQKQQDTLIVWTEANVTDMALSFQEPEGCAAIWDFVNEAQQRLGGGPGLDDLSDELMDHAAPFQLPPPGLNNLSDIENSMRLANSTTGGRDALAKFVVNHEYISKLVPLVEMAEDLESLEDLHRLCNIMKTLILLNDTAIIESAVTDDFVLGVVGALEYDPDFPSHKANHRQYLSDPSRFKEVVNIEEPAIRKKIHYTYRLQYIKDVVLARILDDPTFSVLNSLIFFHQVDIVQHVQSNGMFLKELFSIFAPTQPDHGKRKDAVLFIQQCCAIAKGLQANARQQMYSNFISSGLFNVITFALKHADPSVRVAGTDILMALIDHDTLMMRGQVFKAVNDHQKPLTDILIELLLVETDLGVIMQMADAVKILLDPAANLQSLDAISRSNGDFFKMIKERGTGGNLQADGFAGELYKEGARKLFRPLVELESKENFPNFNIAESTLYAHLLETLCYFVRQHPQRSKFLLVQENIAGPIAKLLSTSEKPLKLSCLKFFRVCIGLHDAFYNERLLKCDVFDGILDIVYETMPKDNLLNSACLELFELIKRENMRDLTICLVEQYGDRLRGIKYVKTFEGLREKYERYMHPPVETLSFTSVETEPPNRGMVQGGQGWRQQGLKEQDAEEEAYFNGTVEEEDVEDELAIGAVRGLMTNGAHGVGTPIKPLVDYPEDDDDGTMDVLAQEPDEPVVSTEKSPKTSPGTPTSSDKPSVTSPRTPSTPPESIAEKRKREDDEEDELTKIATSGTKRRSSSVSSVGSTNGNGNGNGNGVVPHTHHHGLRRKKSIQPQPQPQQTSAQQKDNGNTGRKEKISIALAVKSSSGEGGGE